MVKISIIGAGKVGAACAFALLSLNPKEIVLVDKITDLAKGEAMDLAHAAVSMAPATKVYSDEIENTKDSDFIVITAGKPRGADQTRENLIETNTKVIKSICEDLKDSKAKILIVTNPSTELAQVAKSRCSNVIAIDNQLDTARLKYEINKETNIPLSQITSKSIGPHGEAMQFDIQESIEEQALKSVTQNVKLAGKTIISLKGHTCWGIASQVKEVIEREYNN